VSETADSKEAAKDNVKTTLSREEKKCSNEGCKRPYRAKGYCNVHYAAWRRGELEKHKARYKTCGKEGCKKPMVRWGLCTEHYAAATGKGEEAAKA